jgi:hypothetical protein
VIFAAAFAVPFPANVSVSGSSAVSPHRAASAITGTSPAHDTRLGSSNRTLIAARAWDSRIQRLPEVVPDLVELEVAVPHLSPAVR